MSYTFDPLVPRPIDLPTVVPLDGASGAGVAPGSPQGLAALDEAKIFAAPDDPAAWPAWRERLEAWRTDARERYGFTGAVYERPEQRWAPSCFAVAQVWLWDELLYYVRGRTASPPSGSSPTRASASAARRRGAVARLPRHRDRRPQPVGLLPRRARPHRAWSRPCTTAGLHVFVDYNPWDTGTRRARTTRRARRRWSRTSRPTASSSTPSRRASPSSSSASRPPAPASRLEGESTRRGRAHRGPLVSWAQWFADSSVPGVLRAHWYERRHMHAPRAPLEPRPHRRAAVRLDQRRGRHGVGGRLRRVGRLERARRRDPAPHGHASSAPRRTCCSTASGPRSPTCAPEAATGRRARVALRARRRHRCGPWSTAATD